VHAALVLLGIGTAVAQICLSWPHAWASALVYRSAASSIRRRCLVNHHDLRRLKRLLRSLRVDLVQFCTVQRYHLLLLHHLALKMAVVGLRVLLLLLLLLDHATASIRAVVLCLLGGQGDVLLRQVVEPEFELGILLLCGLVLGTCDDLAVNVGGARLRAASVDRLLCLLELLLVLFGSLLAARRLLGQLQRVCACHFGLLDAGTRGTRRPLCHDVVVEREDAVLVI